MPESFETFWLAVSALLVVLGGVLCPPCFQSITRISGNKGCVVDWWFWYSSVQIEQFVTCMGIGNRFFCCKIINHIVQRSWKPGNKKCAFSYWQAGKREEQTFRVSVVLDLAVMVVSLELLDVVEPDASFVLSTSRSHNSSNCLIWLVISRLFVHSRVRIFLSSEC